MKPFTNGKAILHLQAINKESAPTTRRLAGFRLQARVCQPLTYGVFLVWCSLPSSLGNSEAGHSSVTKNIHIFKPEKGLKYRPPGDSF